MIHVWLTIAALVTTISLSSAVYASGLCYTRDKQRDPACVLLPPYDLSLCTADEAILFSCPIRGRNKTLSVCGSKEITESSGYIQYRFGTKERIDLRYPEAQQPPLGIFTKEYSASYGSGVHSTLLDASVTFSTGQHTYIIYSDWINGSPEALNNDRRGVFGNHIGVKVYRNKKLISNLKCDGDQGLIGGPDDIEKNFPDFLK